MEEEEQYLNLIRTILSTGNLKQDRTGTGTKSIFGVTHRYSLRNGSFPLFTTKKVYWKGVVEELLWFLRGDTDAKKLSAKGVKIWDAHGSRSQLENIGLGHREEGDLGPIYGFQWRHFGASYQDCRSDYTGEGIDQISDLIEVLRTNPDSRRMILTAWNPCDLDKMSLPPCHMMAQFYVVNGELSCQLYQRSADVGLGVPFNVASYALLTNMLAWCCDLQCGDFIHVMGDAHIYLNHVTALSEQATRVPTRTPTIKITATHRNIFKLKMEDVELTGYTPQDAIKMPISV